MKLQDLIDRCHAQALSHGWWDLEGCGCSGEFRSPYTIATLFHSEISEFAEEFRTGQPDVYFNESRSLDIHGHGPNDDGFERANALPKPEGPVSELVDLVIRVADYMGFRNWEFVEVEKTTEELTKTWSENEKFRAILIEDLRMKHPMDFAAMLHKGVTNFVESIEHDSEYDAADDLTTLVSAVVWYFSFRDWNFEKEFETKFRYNTRRPYRHGGKRA